MLKRLFIPLCLFTLLSGFALAQNIAEDTDNAPRPVKLVPLPPPGPVYIRCGALFDGKSDQLETKYSHRRRARPDQAGGQALAAGRRAGR